MACLFLAAALLIPAAAAQAATEQAKAAVQVERSSARLVLEWPSPVDYMVTRAGDYIFVRFSRPFAGKIEAARGALGRYLAEMRLAGGGRVLVMRVAGEPRFAHQRRGNAIVLTWIGARVKRPSPEENPTDSDDPQPIRANVAPGETPRAPDGAVPRSPSAAPEERPKRPSAAPQMHAEPPAPSLEIGAAPPRSPSALRPEQPTRPAVPPEMHAEQPISPKSGPTAPRSPSAYREARPPRPDVPPPEMRAEHAASPKTSTAAPKSPSAYRPEQVSRPAPPPALSAEQPALPKLGETAPKSPPNTLLPEQPLRPAAPPAWRAEQPAGPRTGVPTLRTPVPASDPTPARPWAPARDAQRLAPLPDAQSPKAQPAKSPGAEVDATPPRPAPPEQRAARPTAQESDWIATRAPKTPRAEETEPAPAVVRAPAAPPKPEIRPVPEARPAPAASLEPPVMPAISPTLTVTRDGAETRIALAWPEPVAAAVFRHGDRIWMVFPRREAFDLQPAQRQLGPGLDGLARLEHAQATVLSVHAPGNIGTRVSYERNVWTIAFKREDVLAPLPELKFAIGRNGVEQVTVPLSGAEAPIRLALPKIGNVLHVVPSRATAAAHGERGFVTFRVLPALQGGVVEALADGITIAAESGAITVRRNGGLLLSPDGAPASPQHGQ